MSQVSGLTAFLRDEFETNTHNRNSDKPRVLACCFDVCIKKRGQLAGIQATEADVKVQPPERDGMGLPPLLRGGLEVWKLSRGSRPVRPWASVWVLGPQNPPRGVSCSSACGVAVADYLLPALPCRAAGDAPSFLQQEWNTQPPLLCRPRQQHTNNVCCRRAICTTMKAFLAKRKTRGWVKRRSAQIVALTAGARFAVFGRWATWLFSSLCC